MTLYLFRRGNYRFCVYASSLGEAMGVATYYGMPRNELEYLCTTTRAFAYEEQLNIL